jgi:hypothetical protein
VELRFLSLKICYFFHGATVSSGPSPAHYRGYMIRFSRIPLDEWSARRRDLHRTTHNTHNRKTSMPPEGFVPIISASVRPQTRALSLVHTCYVTTYRNTVSWQCGRDSWPRNASKFGYAVTLRACSVRCRPSHQTNDTATAWAGLDVQRYTSPPYVPLVFFTFMMFLAPVTNWEPHGVTLAGYCYAMRHGMKVQIVTPYRVSQL